MTNTGYQDIIRRIDEMEIITPERPMRATELATWLEGYIDARAEIVRLLDDLQRQNERP